MGRPKGPASAEAAEKHRAAGTALVTGAVGQDVARAYYTARAAKMQAEAVRSRMRTRREQGDLIPRATLRRIMERLAVGLRADCDSAPAVVMQLGLDPAVADHVAAAVDEVTRRLRTRLAATITATLEQFDEEASRIDG